MTANRDIDLTVPSTATLKEAMQAIDKNTLGAVFVIGFNGRFVGVATDGDIRRGILDGVSIDAPIKNVMNDNPLFIYDSWSDERLDEWIVTPEVREKLPEHRDLPIPVLNESDEVLDFVYLSEAGNIVTESESLSRSVETVLIIGGAGYIGSVLAEMLVERGYEVHVLDNLLYGRQGIEALLNTDAFTLIEGDMRSIETIMDAIQGVDAVVHLGGLVGDPASRIDSQKTLELNYHSTKLVAEICKYHQINRFLFASTCSVYGKDENEDLLTETSSLNPISLYAKSKIESERALLDMRDGNFSPTILRKATVYGLSPRMRFDLVVNILTAKAYEEGTIPIFGGKQYRPNVHVRDAARAYIDCLEAPIDAVSGEVFNVGSNEQNYRIEQVGEIISECFPDAEIDKQRQKTDERSYRVDFSKIRNVLDYKVNHSLQDGCLEIKKALENGKFDDFSDKIYSNYRTLENGMDQLRAD